MQKLVKRGLSIHTPTNTSLVCSSVIPSLNRDESLSERNLKTLTNNLKVNKLQHRGEQDLRVPVKVYVLNQRGRPLMPLTPRKARILLKGGKANIINRKPFTIQLNYATGEAKQETLLGVDTGYENVGLSVITNKRELYSAEIKLRNNVSQLLTERRMYKGVRRNKLWYRKARFLNRRIAKDWLAPSINHKIDSHINLIDKVCDILPVTNIKVEVANFDIQKMVNPNIESIEYQQGNLYEHENIKSYLITREHAKCQLCGKESTKGNPFRIHHIIEKNQGGTNKTDNLALVHEKCHIRLHKKNLEHKLTKPKQYKAETFMTIMKNNLVKKLKEKHNNVTVTYGYKTKVNRNKLGLKKSHVNDAFVIVGGSNQIRCKIFSIIQKRHNNRCLQINVKGFKPRIRRQRYKYQPKDVVVVGGKEYDVVGIHSYGNWINVKRDNIKLDFPAKKIERHYFVNGWKIE